MNTFLAGVDPVAVDHVCTKLFCLNPDDIAHITLAEKIGPGTNQRDKIWVKGAAITDIVNINIVEGKNRLLVKTLQKFGDYSFTLNICDPESGEQFAGNCVERLIFYQDSTWGERSSTIRESFTRDSDKNNF